jgi:hypothetical protein
MAWLMIKCRSLLQVDQQLHMSYADSRHYLQRCAAHQPVNHSNSRDCLNDAFSTFSHDRPMLPADFPQWLQTAALILAGALALFYALTKPDTRARNSVFSIVLLGIAFYRVWNLHL